MPDPPDVDEMREPCTHCGNEWGIFELQTFKNGSVHLRVDCSICHRWAYWAPQHKEET